jgi:hypothetical protein
MNSDETLQEAKEVFFPNSVAFSCGIGKVATRADRTLSVQLNSQELPPEHMAKIFELRDKHCVAVVCPFGEEPEPIDLADFEIPEGKSPSKRMKAVMYRMWENDSKGYKDFELFYLNRMEQLITMLKEKLN